MGTTDQDVERYDARSLFAVLTGTYDPRAAGIDATALGQGYGHDRPSRPAAAASNASSASPRRSAHAPPAAALPPALRTVQDLPRHASASARPRAHRPAAGLRPPRIHRLPPPPPPGNQPPSAGLPADLNSRIRTPVAAGHHRIVIIGVSPQSGATTLTLCLADALASFRDDKIVALELDPRGHGLAGRLPPQSPGDAQDLARRSTVVPNEAELRRFITTSPHGLDVIRTRSGPPALSADDYGAVAALLERFYTISVIDAGSARAPAARLRAIQLADQIVVTGPASPPGIQTMPAVLDWLAAIGRPDLTASAAAVLTPASPREHQHAQAHLRPRFPILVTIPHDPHLAEDGQINAARVTDPVKIALLDLVAPLADRFQLPHHRRPGGAHYSPGPHPGPSSH